MQKTSLPYIEDYIEAMAGFKPVLNRPLVVNLARYDIQIIQSMAEQTNRGVAFTDRQAVLAHKIVTKYKKQLAALGVDLGPHEGNAVFRLPTRSIDRSKTIKFHDGKIYIRFPYNEKMIEDIKESAKLVPGEFKFDRDARAWTASVTEPRVLWLQSLVSKHGFELDAALASLADRIVESQSVPYQIELVKTDTGYTITNAESSLLDYVDSNLGGLGADNLLRLVDNSSTLGYTVSPAITEILAEQYNSRVQELLNNQLVHAPLSLDDSLTDILEYANITSRWPIYVFENPMSGDRALRQLEKVFDKDELVIVNSEKKSKKINTDHALCVYLSQWNPNLVDSIPLLITMSALMVGPKKMQLIQCSEKVVYCTEFVYNNKTN
jgi:hypothetical protein